MESQIFRKQFQGSKFIGFPYTIKKLLRRRCLKWVCMIHLNTYNTNYGRKKGQKSKCKFDSQPLKIKIDLIYVCVGDMPHIIEKILMRTTTLLANLISIGGLHNKLWASKVTRVPISGVSRKMTFGCNPHG
jgi:hypothetical protein